MPIDYKKYPPNWSSEIVPRIKARAPHRCERCGIENYAIRKGTKIVLTIAHLDHDSENWDVHDDRLQAMCQRCHLRYDLCIHLYKRKFGLNVYKNNLSLF